MKLYGIKNCNTVKKAIDWLNANKVVFEFHDFKKSGISMEILERWSGQLGWEKLINTKGTTWRQLPEDAKLKVQDQHSAFKLMIDKTSIIKRPILEISEDQIIQGFDEGTYAEKLIS